MERKYKAIYTWGSNSYGQLGLGHAEDVNVPFLQPKLSFDAHDAFGGGAHAFFVDKNKLLYGCGWNKYGQLGLDIDCQYNFRVVPINSVNDLKKTVLKVSAGWDFSVILVADSAQNKQLYGIGSNLHGQIATDDNSIKFSTTPMRLMSHIENVSAGLRHVVALSTEGEIISWGSCSRGQLGLEFLDTKKRKGKPINLNMPVEDRVKEIVAGAYHSACLTDNGQVVVWGDNKHGQLGHNPSEVKNLSPTLVDQVFFDYRKVVDLSSGWTHMVATLDNGEIFSWGRYDYGQLGRPANKNDFFIPSRIPFDFNVASVSCGAEHTLVNTTNFDLWSFGWGEHGVCGAGSFSDIHSPHKIELDAKVNRIICGNGFSLALSS